MKYLYNFTVSWLTNLFFKIMPQPKHTSIVLTTRQMATINAMAAKATSPDYVVITMAKGEHSMRFVSFIKDHDGKSYQSNTLSVRVDGWSPDLPQVAKEEPDNETTN